MPMSPTATPLVVVPVRTDALLVNKATCAAGRAWPHYRGWLDYSREFADPQQDSLEETVLDSARDVGAHLHWRLPEALGRGRVDAQAGPEAEVAFPPAPNRWLVLRYHHPDGRPPKDPPDAAGWLVESDYTSSDHRKATSPVRKKLWMGRALDLTASSFQPDNASGRTRLTALGLGADLPTFAVYQPYCRDVFSLQDPLRSGTGGNGSLAKGHLSYLVIGWHTHADDEPCADLPALLDFYGDTAHAARADWPKLSAGRLNWRTPTDLTPETRTVYHGLVMGLYWDPAAGIPTTPRRPGDPRQFVKTALGHDTSDALAALVEQTLPAPPAPEDAPDNRRTAELLHAFHTGQMPAMDRAVGGAQAQRTVLWAALHQAWFTPSPSGLRWHVTHGSATAGPPPTDGQYSTWRPLLAALNTTQAALDQALSDITAARRHVADLWWLHGLGKETSRAPDGFVGQVAKELDPATAGTSAHRLKTMLDRLPAARASVADALAALRKALPRGWDAVPAPTDPYHSPGDPAVLLRGTGQPTGEVRRGTPLPVRTPGQLITTTVRAKRKAADTAYSLDVTAPDPPPLPTRWTDAAKLLPAKDHQTAAVALAKELYLLHALAVFRRREHRLGDGADLDDPALVHVPAGVWPDACRTWQQPWTPVALVWTAHCHPLPYERPRQLSLHRTELWEFDGASRRLRDDDGTRRAVRRHCADKDLSFHHTGRSWLTPLPGFALRGRVDAHQRTFPASDGGKDPRLEELRTQANGWDLQSQTLTGLRAALFRRVPGSARAPLPAALAPLLGAYRNDLWPAPEHSCHQPVQTEHFALVHTAIVDTFGQAVTVVTREGNKHLTDRPYRARSVTPRYAVCEDHGQRFTELPPRLRQPARLLLTPLAHTSVPGGPDEEVDVSSDPLLTAATPIGGWLLARHTGDPGAFTLALYGPRGQALGELARIGPPGKHAVTWRPLPGSSLMDPAAVFDPAFSASYPMPAGFAQALLDVEADAIADGRATPTGKPLRLAALAAAIDASLLHSTPRPPVGTSLAAGHPLALVRLRVHLELDGPPRTDPTWGTAAQGWGGVFATDETTDPAGPGRRWPVRLGTGPDAADGLVGYYTNASADPAPGRTSYETFHTVHPVREPGSYAVTIGTGRNLAVPAVPRSLCVGPGDAAYLTALLDPRLALTAHTDILPATAFRVPPPAVQRTLDRMRLSIPLGPALCRTRLDPAASTDQPGRLTLPAPGAAGHWAFATLEDSPPPASPWHLYDLTRGVSESRLEPAAPDARHGHLTATAGDTPPPAPARIPDETATP
ncbi:hypothetical protein [Streptomyces buecherae]|uniref:hypothetical protein n=1 Tax=Streptomyces buecherae TaxID=2763006 RepID=UPI0037B8B87F